MRFGQHPRARYEKRATTAKASMRTRVYTATHCERATAAIQGNGTNHTVWLAGRRRKEKLREWPKDGLASPLALHSKDSSNRALQATHKRRSHCRRSSCDAPLAQAWPSPPRLAPALRRLGASPDLWRGTQAPSQRALVTAERSRCTGVRPGAQGGARRPSLSPSRRDEGLMLALIDLSGLVKNPGLPGSRRERSICMDYTFKLGANSY